MDKAPWWRGTRGEWYVVAQAVLFVLIGVGPRTLPGLPTWAPPWTTIGTWLGLALMLPGAALSIGGVLKLGKNLTPLPYPKDNSELVEQGPYAIVRHPIYGGLILGAFGWGLYLHAWVTLGFAALLFVLFDIKSRREERWLIERFPEYSEYCRRVKKLLPWVY
ncbi:MAG TPA: isoprenylcysteine carboxylmethyltransferase family protein [Coriobacteriia bacterium]|nr:isoprenylcysteine carboxylmethyltransferase family protein [Coriobacteriia bacterium]